MTLTISENNKTALSKPEIDAMTQVYTDAVADSATAAVAADTALGTAVKGTNWTSGMTLKAHDDAIKALGTAVKGTDWTSDMTLKAHDDAINALERSGTTVAVGGVATADNRDIVLTIKNGAGTPAAVFSYAVVGVKVTKSSVGGADSAVPAVIGTDLDTAGGLTVVAGEKIPAGAIADSANASLVAITKADGTLTVNIKNTTTHSRFFVHFILPDGTVKTSAIVELNAS